MEKQKTRNEIDDKYKWDLTSIYKNDKEFLDELKKIEKEIDKIKKYENTFLDSGKNLYEFLEYSNEIDMNIEKLYMYAHLKNDEDLSNNTYQKYYGLVINLLTKLEETESFIIPEFMKIEYDDIKKMYKEDNRLLKYERHLKKIYEEKKYTLSEKEEKLLSKLSKAFDSSDSVYELLTDSDFKFGNIVVDGKEIELTESNYSVFLESSDQNVRKDAFKLLFKTYKDHINSISKCLSNTVESNSTMAKIRGFKSSLDKAMFDDRLDINIYNNLIKTVKENVDPYVSYLKLKKDILNLSEMHIYDTYTKVVKDYDKKYSFDDAKKLVLDGLSPLGEDYIKTIEKAFDQKWIDVYNNKGKRGGAYSSGGYLTNPYLLLNYEGKFDDVRTLAHELGHSMHSYYTNKNNEYINSGYSIFVAEVASTVNELLLSYYVLNNTDDKEEKLYILDSLINLYKGTLYRQTMFAEFEKTIYEESEKGEILTSEFLNEKYLNLVKDYFKDSCILDDEIKYEWARIPHFYYFFYVFKYATSICASTYIVKEILSGNKDIKEKYLKFLTLGNKLDPADELLTMGIDMTDKKVIEDTISYFKELVDEFNKLINEKVK